MGVSVGPLQFFSTPDMQATLGEVFDPNVVRADERGDVCVALSCADR
jgi:hypothetical protein